MIESKTITVSNFLHLSGGLRAVTGREGKLTFLYTSKNLPIACDVTDTGKYAGVFKSLNLTFIGYEQIWIDKGMQNSVWYPYTPHDVIDLWSQIAHSARKLGEKEASEVAHNISFSLRAASLRLRDVSREYETQNHHAIVNEIKPKMGFANIKDFDLYMGLHSFLVELCAARDYLARFIAYHVIKGIDADSMVKLLQKFEKKKYDYPLEALIIQLCDQDDPLAWMARLTRYRNLISHAAPISQISENKMMFANQMKFGDEECYLIYVGIPIDPIRSLENNFVDALDHFQDLMLKMFQFAKDVANTSGITPSMPHFTEKDILKKPK